MLHCSLLKEFHEKYNNFIALADSTRNQLVRKGSHRTCDMGGSCGKYIARFKVLDDSVVIQIGGNNFSLMYYSVFADYTHLNTFYSTDTTAEIEFGNPDIKNQFKVCGVNCFREMEYPIAEEQYFQNLTAFPLSTEEVYQYFMSIDTDHSCDIQLTTIGDGINELEELLTDVKTMNSLFSHIQLVSVAYKKTNGL